MLVFWLSLEVVRVKSAGGARDSLSMQSSACIQMLAKNNFYGKRR